MFRAWGPSGFNRVLLKGSWDLVSKVISRVIVRITPFRALITPIITYLLSSMIL